MLSQMTTVAASYLHDEELRGNTYSDEDLKQLFQSLIWELNMPLRSGSQSAFSNASLEFGKASEEIKDDYVIIGGEPRFIQYKDVPSIYFDRINKAIIDVMAEGTGSNGIPFTFPLLTVQIDDNFNYDNPLFKELLDKMYHWGGVYYENFKTKPFEDEYYTKLNPTLKPRDPEVSRSLCPLDGAEEVLYYSEKLRKLVSSPIKELYKSSVRCDIPIRKVVSNGKLVDAKINQFQLNEFAEITLVNGLKIKTTLNHLNKTLRGNEIPTSELTTDDYLPISRKVLQGEGLTYDEGYLVGAFLGDGSFDKGNENKTTFSLNVDTDHDLVKFIEEIIPAKYGGYTNKYLCTSSISGKQKCVNVTVASKYLKGLIEQFVKGDNALNKEIDSKAFMMSEEFRRGIIDGLYKTDGGNNNRIYTSSKLLVKSFTTLCATLGISVRINEDNRENRLGTNTCYIIRTYAPDKNKSKYEGVYILDEDYMWFKVSEINTYSSPSNTYAYCLEIASEDEEPIFMMSNGIVTHNCRLQIDLTTLSRAGGGVFGSSTGSTGAVQVLNLNLNRMLLEFGHDKELLKSKIREYMEVMQAGHMAKRKWIEANKDLYPTFFAFNENLKNYFNVFAVTGMHEGLINLGFEGGMVNEEGKKLAHELMQYISEIINDFIVRDQVACGVEYAPKLCGCKEE